MRLPAPTLLLGAFSGAAVFVLVLNDLQRTSPGPLAHVHQRVPELADADGCNECHGGLFDSMTDACLDCHEVIGEHMEAGAGLHGVFEPELARSCALCHSDHHGEGFALVDVHSFVHAGFANQDAFDHSRIGFHMEGRHTELGCVECHVNADERILPEGEYRFLGLTQDCASCHDDPHEGRMGHSCATCHAQTDFLELAPLDHDEHLSLASAHAEVDCRSCHAEDDAHALEALGHSSSPAPRECAACHDAPHRTPFLEGVAGHLGTTAGASCDHCHTAATVTSFWMQEPTMAPAEHAFTGFALAAPHDEASCADCHEYELGSFEARHPGRDADTCSACHEDVHEGQFEDGPFGDLGCLGCHERTHFEPHAFEVADHARTGFELVGTHATTGCEECHSVPPGAEVRRFADTPGTCEDCHDDAHLGHFAAVLAERAVERDSCAECHLTTTFADLDQGSFDHAEWTGFTVEGAHAHSACESCHTRAEEPNDLGRRFGCVAELFGALTGCETCHADPHAGGFDERPGVPQHLNGHTGCARCHVESSFRVMRDEFDHGLWTGFPLVGQHFELACADCHAPLATPDESGRTWERARGQECSDCHSNPHAGQFRENGRTDCKQCHQSATSWSRLVFDHDRDSRFPLEDAHEQLECSACHETWTPPDGRGPGIVRYRPLGIECADCHGRDEGGRR